MSDYKVFNPDFIEFVELLNRHKVSYLITGGYAVAVYGYPRYTGDIDVWVGRSVDNARKLVKVFDEFGLSSFGLTEGDFTKEDQIIQIGYPPYRIDILTSIDGVTFKEAFAARNRLTIDGLELLFISRDDLLKNKLASGRARDLDDLENLTE